ncbi:MAG: ACP phosphodiesterase [Saprospiraceae bacterium]
MNFLAHTLLAGEEEGMIVGNFIADFLRGKKQLEAMPEPIQKGIFIHRKIDAFTDKHPVVKQSYNRLKPTQGRYAGVIIDVLYDYFLVKNWSKYSSVPLDELTQTAYRHFEKHINIYPKSLQKRLPLMIADDWMVRYGELDGLRFTFSKMALRIKFPNQFHTAVDDLIRLEAELDMDFNAFFPNLVRYIEEEKKNILTE